MGARRLVRFARELLLFKRKPMPLGTRAAVLPVDGTRATALPSAALAALLVAATTVAAAAMPLRDAAGLGVSCRIGGLPQREVAAAESALCAQVVASARREAPYRVGPAPAGDAAGLRLAVDAQVTGSDAARAVAITARLTRPGQSATAPRLTSAQPPVAYGDAVAVAAAVDRALAAILPWRAARRAPLPTPPRAY